MSSGQHRLSVFCLSPPKVIKAGDSKSLTSWQTNVDRTEHHRLSYGLAHTTRKAYHLDVQNQIATVPKKPRTPPLATRHLRNSISTIHNKVKGSDIILILVAIIFPPAAAGIIARCSCDLTS